MIRTIIFDLDDTLLWDEKSIATAFDKDMSVRSRKAT